MVIYPQESPERQEDVAACDALLGHCGIVHEFSHWIQHHGTTVGALLSLLRYSQEATCFTGIQRLNGSERELVFERRLSRKEPLVPVRSQTGDLDNSSLDWAHTPLKVWAQMWHDHQLVHAACFSADLQAENTWPRGQVFGEVMGDTFLFACDLCGLGDYPGHKVARRLFRFDDEEVKFVKIKGQHFTTSHIMECAATINETLATARLPLPLAHSHLSRSIEVLLHGNYGLPLRAFQLANGVADSDLAKWLPTISALCDVSLNPPVPPYIIDFEKVVAWSDFYPPIRFLRASTAAMEVGMLSRDSTHEIVIDYVRKICECADLEDYTTYRHSFSDAGAKFDMALFEMEERHEGLPKTYHEYVLWVQMRMSALRRENLPLFVNFGECHSGDLSKKAVGYMMGHHGKFFFRPQLVWDHDGALGHADSRGLGSWLFTSRVVHYLLFDLMAGHGQFDLSALPPGVRGSSILKEKIANTFHDDIGIPAKFQLPM
jgi:hypothetical protein